MIYGIDGMFGSGKTSYIVHLMASEYKDYQIWTNIQVDLNLIPNAIIIGDQDLLDVLRTINEINDKERALYSIPRPNSNLFDHDRSAFTKHLIVIDESSSHLNAKDYKEVDTFLYMHLDQQRKNFLDLYFLTPNSETLVKGIRRHVIGWISLTPILDLGWFSNFLRAEAIFKDAEGKPIMESFIDKDEMGTPVLKQRPVIEQKGWFYRKKWWYFYDDLHKNITDSYTDHKMYRAIVDDWIGESEEQEETKRGKYLDIFGKVFKKRDSYNLDSLDKQEAIDPKETNKNTIL